MGTHHCWCQWEGHEPEGQQQQGNFNDGEFEVSHGPAHKQQFNLKGHLCRRTLAGLQCTAACCWGKCQCNSPSKVEATVVADDEAGNTVLSAVSLYSEAPGPEESNNGQNGQEYLQGQEGQGNAIENLVESEAAGMVEAERGREGSAVMNLQWGQHRVLPLHRSPLPVLTHKSAIAGSRCGRRPQAQQGPGTLSEGTEALSCFHGRLQRGSGEDQG